jgi:hypothetical protein
MIVLTAGVIMNTHACIFIFYVITIAQGRTRMETTTVGYVAKIPLLKIWNPAGDKIFSVNGSIISTGMRSVYDIY